MYFVYTSPVFSCSVTNSTDQLQPLDLKPVKDFMRGKFQEWYANQVLQNYGDESDGCTSPRPIQFPMSQMKPLEHNGL